MEKSLVKWVQGPTFLAVAVQGLREDIVYVMSSLKFVEPFLASDNLNQQHYTTPHRLGRWTEGPDSI